MVYKRGPDAALLDAARNAQSCASAQATLVELHLLVTNIRRLALRSAVPKPGLISQLK